jgi:lipid-binding SYLF domain-containing protein
MSGHNKWSSIKHKKGAADARRGKMFSKLAKEIMVTARQGGGDESANPALRTLVQKAKGILVLPNVKKGALIVGGEYGKGAMRIGGKSVEYYSMASGSIGLQIGGQAKDVIIAFMSSDALKNFRESKGWEAGVDGNVALASVGAGESAMTAMHNQPIVAFVFDVKGLMADLSFKGAKFNKLDMDK